MGLVGAGTWRGRKRDLELGGAGRMVCAVHMYRVRSARHASCYCMSTGVIDQWQRDYNVQVMQRKCKSDTAQ